MNIDHKYIFYSSFIVISLIPLTLITGPAIPDISLTIVSIIFVITLVRNKYYFASSKLVFFSIFFWFTLVLLNLISLNFYKSLGESLIFLRIILLPIIMYVWLYKKNNFIKFVLIIILISNLIVIFDTLYQFNNYHPLNGFGVDIFNRRAEIYGRLSGPFLDMVPGSYISKFFIFGFIGLTYLIKHRLLFNFSAIFYLSLCGYITFISGEKMAMATFFLGMVLGIILLKYNRKIFFISSIFIVILCSLTLKYHDHYQNYKIIESNPGHLGLIIEKYDSNCENSINCSKIIKTQPKFISILSNFKETAYYEVYSLSLSMIKYQPITGIGMNNFNYACENIDIFKQERCWSHPHNFYLQWLTENGLIGFSIFIIYIILIFYTVLFSNSTHVYKNYSFIALSIIFWPIMSTGSLFKNWHGIETFFIIGLSLSLMNYYKIKD